MKTKKLLFFTVFIYCFCQLTFGYAQQAGLVLINKDRPNKQRLLKKGKTIKFTHFSNGQLLVTRGTLEGRINNFIKINPKKIYQVNPKDRGISNELFNVSQIPIKNLLSLSPKRPFGKEFISFIGYIIAIAGGTIIVGGLAEGISSPYVSGFVKGGAFWFGIGGVLIWSTRKKKYKIKGGPWVIN